MISKSGNEWVTASRVRLWLNRHRILSTVLCVVLVHLPFWLVQKHLFELRPFFSYDLLLLLLLSALLNRRLTMPTLCCWLLDLFQSVATSFHFANAADFAGTIRFARLLILRDFLSGDLVMLVCLFVVAALLLAYGLRHSRIAPVTLLAILIGAAGLDVLNGSTRLPGLSRDSVLLTTNIAGSPMWNLFNRLKAGRSTANAPPQLLRPVPVSNAAMQRWLSTHPDGSVLVVLV